MSGIHVNPFDSNHLDHVSLSVSRSLLLTQIRTISKRVLSLRINEGISGGVGRSNQLKPRFTWKIAVCTVYVHPSCVRDYTARCCGAVYCNGSCLWVGLLPR